MYSASFLVLAFAVFGASAHTFISSGCNGGLLRGVSTGLLSSGVTLSNGIGSGIVGGIGGASTPVLESPTIALPGLVTPSAVHDTCNCVQTVVKPTLRQEVYNIPSVQRFVQTSATPIVESVPYVSGGAMDVPTAVQGGSGLALGSSFGAGSGLALGSSLGAGSALIAAPAMSAAPSFISAAPAVSAAPSFISSAPSFISAPAVAGSSCLNGLF